MRETIKAVLSAVLSEVYWITVPVNDSAPEQYITFNVRQVDALYADNSTAGTYYVVYVDFYSTSDDQQKADAIKAAMNAAGFAMTDDMPMYETDTDRWHVSTTWVGVA